MKKKNKVDTCLLVAVESIKNVQTTIRARLVNEILQTEDEDDVKQAAIDLLNAVYGNMTESLNLVESSGLVKNSKMELLNKRKEKELSQRRAYD